MSKLLNAKEELITLPDKKELERFIECFPKFTKEYRQELLWGYFQDKSIDELREDVLNAKGINSSRISAQQKGGVNSGIVRKVKSVVIRILFLRYYLDEGFSRKLANNKLVRRFGSDIAKDVGMSAIRKQTGKFKDPK